VNGDLSCFSPSAPASISPSVTHSLSRSSLVVFVEVYKWIVLALSTSSDFWLRWLVHEA
jgi:hypothetical protein